jgi:hypothetical protein
VAVIMTARKPNPSKRGRKELARGVREAVYLRFRSFYRDEKTLQPKRLRRDIADDFVARNQSWFASIGMAIGNYPSLRNKLVEGRRERAARRRLNWGLLTDLRGKRYFRANAMLYREAMMRALDVVKS